MSPHAHDLITSAAVAVLLAGMLPAVRDRTLLPLPTCIVTATACELLAANWATSGYWYSASVEFANAACWSFLLAIALRAASYPRSMWLAGACAPLVGCGMVMCLSASTDVGSGVSAAAHGAIVAAIAVVLTVAMAPTVYRRAVLPLSTCLTVGGAVTVLCANFATMGYWYASAIEATNSACWAFLLIVTSTTTLGDEPQPSSSI